MNRRSPIAGLSQSPFMHVVARVGLTARGTVYLLMGSLVLLVANGSPIRVDQKSAVAQLLDQPYGRVLVVLMVLGFVAYAIWRLSEAAFGVAGEGHRIGPRVQSLVRGLIYSSLAVTTTSLLIGSQQSQSAQQQGYARTALSMSGGRWIVAAAGLGIAASGAFMIDQGATAGFMRFFPGGSTSTRMRRAIRTIGRIGTISRGFVFVVVGGLVIFASWMYKPSKASGVDAAVTAIQGWPFGYPLLSFTAAGLVLFGIYGLCEARYRRV